MTKRTDRFEFESDEERAKHVKEVIAFFKNERDEEIGIIAAGNLLDFFLQTMGEQIYKKAINDCKKILREKVEDLEVDLDLLAQDK